MSKINFIQNKKWITYTERATFHSYWITITESKVPKNQEKTIWELGCCPSCIQSYRHLNKHYLIA